MSHTVGGGPIGSGVWPLVGLLDPRPPDYLDINVMLAVLDDIHVGVEDGALTGPRRPAVHRAQHLHQSEDRKHTSSFMNREQRLLRLNQQLCRALEIDD